MQTGTQQPVFAHLLAGQDESLAPCSPSLLRSEEAIIHSPSLLSWDFISQATLACQVTIQLMSALCMLAWVQGRVQRALHQSQKLAILVWKMSLNPEL